MAGNIQNVSFMSPQAMIAPDLSVQQQQQQRQSDLAAALRQMSFDPIDAGKGNIAWTQGAAKLAQALAGIVVQKRADKQQINLNQAMQDRMFGKKDANGNSAPGMFGGYSGGGGQSSGGGGAPPPSISPPAPQQAPVIQPPQMRAQPPSAPLPDQNAMPQQMPQAAPPQQMPQQMPQMPPQQDAP